MNKLKALLGFDPKTTTVKTELTSTCSSIMLSDKRSDR